MKRNKEYTYLNTIAGQVLATELANTTAAFANVDSFTVPDDQLLNPTEAVKPTAGLGEVPHWPPRLMSDPVTTDRSGRDSKCLSASLSDHTALVTQLHAR